MRLTALLLLTMASICGCDSGETYTKYSRYKAEFAYYHVQTTTPLRSALYSPGDFCTIKLTIKKQLHFSTFTQQQKVDVTAPNMYQNYVCISGFIVGYSNMIELGADSPTQVCYDLACPNCYRESSIKRDLAIKEGGFAYCSRCKRTYSLNNFGTVQAGDAGRPLERYHISLPNQYSMNIYN